MISQRNLIDFFFFFFISLLGVRCSTTSGEQYESAFSDGTYCSYLSVYDRQHGGTYEYDVEVKIDDNKLVSIEWPTEHFLVNDSFDPAKVGEDGTGVFISEMGFKYYFDISDFPCSFRDRTIDAHVSPTNSNTFGCYNCGDANYELIDGLCPSCYASENGGEEEDYY